MQIRIGVKFCFWIIDPNGDFCDKLRCEVTKFSAYRVFLMKKLKKFKKDISIEEIKKAKKEKEIDIYGMNEPTLTSDEETELYKISVLLNGADSKDEEKAE